MLKPSVIRRTSLILVAVSLTALAACSSMGEKMGMMHMQHHGVALSGAQEVPPVTTSATGMAILEKGGNAFDAGVATGFALQVVEPHLNGPGGEVPMLMQALKQYGLTLEKIWITHGHLDHAGGAAEMQEKTGLDIIGPHPDDQFWISRLGEQAGMFRFPPSRPFEPTRWLYQGNEVAIGAETLQVRHCPGHTPGHVVFISESASVSFVGDVLFTGSIGRTDFPLGDHQTLIDAIRRELWPLDDDMRFVPGHGPSSTFGREKASNPYLSQPVW